MAVTAVRMGRLARRQARAVCGADIQYLAGGKAYTATKLKLEEFNDYHRKALMTACFASSYELVFDEPGWRSAWVGGGEEKVVFLVIDPQQRALAVELLARGTYQEGHLTEGHYFCEIFAAGIANKRWDNRSLFGHIFSGRVKVREFIYGDTLAGPGVRQVPAGNPGTFRQLVGKLSRAWAGLVVHNRYGKVKSLYSDAHEANVMIELLPLSNPEKKNHYLLPVPWLEDDGKLRLRYYRLTPIDVRVR